MMHRKKGVLRLSRGRFRTFWRIVTGGFTNFDIGSDSPEKSGAPINAAVSKNPYRRFQRSGLRASPDKKMTALPRCLAAGCRH
jgi:hypothetical protein